MTTGSAFWQRVLAAVLIAVPLLSLGVQAVMWLRYGIDLPFFDDFRSYDSWTAHSLALKDLFRSANDTLYPVGIALDALSHRYLAGNSIAYQLISMLTLLGGLLWVQWRLLSYALQDHLAAAAAFALCAFMIQPGTYWGFQDMAYHQGLPTLLILAALAITLLAPWPRWLAIAAVFVLGLLAGFTYISGAAGTLVTGLALMLLGRMRPDSEDERRAGTLTLQQGATALLSASLITVPAQAWVILWVQRGLNGTGGAFAFPWDPAYWVFLFAKVARAVALPQTQPYLSLALAAALSVLGLATGALLLRRMAANRAPDPAAARVTTAYAVLFAMVSGYLVMLAAGRTNLYGSDLDFDAVFQMGYGFRMHFFWVTLLPPWLAAAGFIALKDRSRLRLMPRAALCAFASVVLVGAAGGGVFNHQKHFSELMEARLVTHVGCLREKLSATGEDMLCPWLYPADLRDAYIHALLIGASFTRHFILQPIPLGASPEPLLRLSSAATDAISLTNVISSGMTAEGASFQPTNGDPILTFTLPPEALKKCFVVDVTLRIKYEHEDTAQLFLLRPGQTGFAEPRTAEVGLSARDGGFGEVTLRGISPNGFQDEIRVDPVSTSQPFTIKDLEVRCRVHQIPGRKHGI